MRCYRKYEDFRVGSYGYPYLCQNCRNKFKPWILSILLIFTLISVISLTSAVTMGISTNYNTSLGINLSCDITSYCDLISVNADSIYLVNFSRNAGSSTTTFNLTNVSNMLCSDLPYVSSSVTSGGNQIVTIPSNVGNINVTVTFPSTNVFGADNAKSVSVNGNSNPFGFTNSSIYFNSLLNNGNNSATVTYFTADNSPNGFCSIVTNGYSGFFSGIIVVFVILAVGIIIFIMFAISKSAQGESLDTSFIDNIFEILPVKVVMISILAIVILVWIIIMVMGALCSV